MVERIREFRRTLQRASAGRVLPTRHGTAILGDAIPDVYDHNYVSVEEALAGADELAADADEALAERHHRRVIVEQGTPGVADRFAALGYVLSTHLVLAHTRLPDRRVDTSAVRELPLDDVLPARTEATLREPWGDAALARQLNEAKRQVALAVPTRFYAAIADGTVAGWCELRVARGVAQIEDVEVLAEFRGRGLGRALVQQALDAGSRTADVVFLEALADDWPRELYAKLGFTAIDRRDVYTRLPSPVTRLRLRVRGLELRVPTVAELRRLGRSPDGGVELLALRDGVPVGLQRLAVGRRGPAADTLFAADSDATAGMRAAIDSLRHRLEDGSHRDEVEIDGLEHALPALRS